ncbi:type I methionyl aminopeptidase [Nonomuraea sp. NPDC050663]|uniref:type I methionyl aminopeptidase n=1 Tax=Nonomuraea sp. NPDC050663 TaxID=3364370 RepID=UPI00379605F6
MVELKTTSEIEAMREAGRVVAAALRAVREQVAPGVSLLELDEVAAAVMDEHAAKPAFLHYRPHFAPTPFPAVICTSVNEVIVHGIPTRRRLERGDLLSVDCGVYLDGWAGDAAFSMTVGAGRAEDLELIATAEAALAAGIAAAVPGARLGDVGHAIGQVAARGGCGVPDGFGGHGIGRHMHEDPSVPNRGRPGRGMVLRPGLVLAIEPMLVAGGDGRYHELADGWSLASVSGRRAAHAEHTVAVTQEGPLVLTAL